MTRRLPLSALASIIHESIEHVFADESFWVIAEITDVKKYEQKRWCFLKFIEKNKEQIIAEMHGVFWANAFQQIVRFEQATGQLFENGLQISCMVSVKFHPRYGLKLEVQEIDASFTLGQLERQRQQTLDQLLRQYPGQIQLVDGEYITTNKQLVWPKVLQRIALIAAAGSDGERDFLHELLQNQYGYHFEVIRFAASVQGQQAVADLCEQLDTIRQQASSFDVVALVRGGGSHTDFAAFEHFELARRIAVFPIPVFTGIGHDRNTSIADLMCWQWKTPTKAAAAIVDTALRFDSELQTTSEKISQLAGLIIREHRNQLTKVSTRLSMTIPHRLQRKHERLSDWHMMLQKTTRDQLTSTAALLGKTLQQIQVAASQQLQQKKIQLKHQKLLVEQLSPERILKRGFAMVMQEGKIITDVQQLQKDLPMQTILKATHIISEIKDISTHESSNI